MYQEKPGQYVATQPGFQQGMSMHNPALDAGMQRDSSGEREWKNGICGCCNDCGNFCLAFWCPCMAYGKNKSRYNHLQEHNGQPHPDGGDCCNSDCFIHGLLDCCGVGWIMQIMSRGDVRRRYRIKGSGCGDCCAAWCCMPCELTQEHLELQEEEDMMRQRR